ncbi:MAG: hypothetical protein JRI68_25810 [Deltaproteobacteria bacterium]|nr:hypothetical protein [Deltaproteobacteria bacterium]
MIVVSTKVNRWHGLGRAAAWAAVGVVGIAGLVSCLATTPKRTAGDRIARSKCGGCHVRPEPGGRSRSDWERILDEHDERFPLSASQRRTLLDHFAPAGVETPP